MIPCDPERLEQLVLGELSPAQAELVTAHARTCDDCAAEIALLRRERAVFAERASVLAGAVPASATDVQRPVRKARFPWAPAAAGVVLALAAAFLLALRLPSLSTPREPAAALPIGADPAAQEMCEDDGFVHEPKSPLKCEEPARAAEGGDSGVTNSCR
jgi:anti-sigma factor RsiW